MFLKVMFNTDVFNYLSKGKKLSKKQKLFTYTWLLNISCWISVNKLGCFCVLMNKAQHFFSRWIRLLFGREFPMQDLLALWDAIFADGVGFELVDFVFVAMLLYIRDLCKQLFISMSLLNQFL